MLPLLLLVIKNAIYNISVNNNIKLFSTSKLLHPVLNLHINPHAISIKLTILIMQISIVKQAKTNRLLFVTNHDDDNNPL